MPSPSPSLKILVTDQTGLNMSYQSLAILIGGSSIGLLIIIVTLYWIKLHGAPTPQIHKIGLHKKKRKGKKKHRPRTKTQLKTIKIVTRQLHSFYRDQEEQGIVVAQHQREAHQRLQERLANRKSVKDAVREHKEVLAAIQAHKEGKHTDIGEAFAEAEGMKNLMDVEKVDEDEFDLDELSLEQDEAIDQMKDDGTFKDAIDDKNSKRMRRETSLKIMHVLKIEKSTTVKIGVTKEPSSDFSLNT
jgi:hypothetical protein